MSEFIREINGRVAKAEISVYDAMMAEILRDRMAEKEHVRNRRKAARKHDLAPKARKEQRYARNWSRYSAMPGYGCKDICLAEYRMNNAEFVARADYALNCANRETEAEAYADAVAESRDFRKFAENAMAGYLDDCASGWELEYAIEYIDMAQGADRKAEYLRIGLEVR